MRSGSTEMRSESETSVFLSYARPDRAKAVAVAAALEAQGFKVWWDGLIEGGGTFADNIEDALGTADAVVVLWSAQSIQSHWVRDEAAHGRDRKRLVPVSIDGTEPPLGFRQIQLLDLKRWRGKADDAEAQALYHAVRAVAQAGGMPARAVPPAPAAVTRRRAIAIGGGAVAAAGVAAGAWTLFGSAAANANSIVVLPFRNLSGNPAEDYFSEGLSEELRATLSRNAELSVAAQTSSEKVADKASGAKGVAQALGVAFLLEGSVRHSKEVLRISARIIDGNTGFDTWSQTFDRGAGDILAVQSEIATSVADALLGDVLFKRRTPAERLGGTRNAGALDSYLRGAALYRQASGEADDRAALAAFDAAVNADPDYAAAHAARSRALTVIANTHGRGAEIKELYRSSIEAANTAARISPDMAEGHSALGFVLFNGQLDARAARGPYQRSFELGYGNADILSAYGNFAGRVGEFADGRKAIGRAMQLDPLNGTVFRNAGLLEFAARDYAAALTRFRTALSINPKSNNVRVTLGDIEMLKGNAEAARAQYQQEPDEIGRLRGTAIADMRLSRKAAAEAGMAELVRKFGDSSKYQQAQVLAQWGRSDDALDALEKAYSVGDAGLVRSRNDPMLDPIRKHARFAAIQRAIGFA